MKLLAKQFEAKYTLKKEKRTNTRKTRFLIKRLLKQSLFICEDCFSNFSKVTHAFRLSRNKVFYTFWPYKSLVERFQRKQVIPGKMSVRCNRIHTIHKISICVQNQLYPSRNIRTMLSVLCSPGALEFLIFIQISINFSNLKRLKIKE